MSKIRNKNLLFLTAILVGGGAVAWGATQGGWFRAEESEALAGAEVRRGDLLISEVVRGELEASNSESHKSELEGNANILWLIEEGTRVKKGELLCELDVSSMQDRLIDQQIAVDEAEARWIKAKEQLAIQELDNQTDIAQAELTHELAVMDLEKYTAEEGEWTHELKKLDEQIAEFTEELTLKQKELTFTTKLYDKGFAQMTELEEDQAAVNRITLDIQQSEREKALKEQFENTRRTKELESDVATALRDVEKTKLQAAARLVDFQADLNSAKYKLDRERQKLEEIEQQLGKAKIYAKADGITVYGRKRSRWGSGEPVEQGGEVYERQEIISIPQSGSMTAKASLHETRLKMIRAGQRVRVTVEALPGRSFEGVVSYVAQLPDSGSMWSNPNQRLYRSEITLEEGVEEMRPGMSCSIEILVENLVDVLYVPRQAVFYDGSETIAFAIENGAPARRPVQVGLDNNKWVAIESGLSEGEVVALSPPADFTPAPRDEASPEGTSESVELVEKGEVENVQRGGRAAAAAAAGPGGDRPGAAAMAGGQKPTAEQIEQWKKARESGAAQAGSAAGGAERGSRGGGRSQRGSGGGGRPQRGQGGGE